jgi:hypothetical protein
MPLTPYFDAIRREQEFLDSGEDLRAKWVDQVEAYVAQCMAEAGFEYYPTPLLTKDNMSAIQLAWREQGLLTDPRLPVPALPDDRQDVASGGYGRWLGVHVNDIIEADPSAYANPNLDYLSSLSAEGEAQYLAALGEGYHHSRGDFLVQTWTLNHGGSGCTVEAIRQIPEPGADYVPAIDAFEHLVFGGMLDVQYKTDQDPATLSLNREWQQCMNDAGVDVREEILTGDGGGTSVESGPVSAFRLAVQTGADGQAADRSRYLDETLPKDQRSLIGSGPELAIALADFDCRGQTGYMSRLIAIHRGLEQDFLDQNRSALDQMAAAIDRNLQAAGW